MSPPPAISASESSSKPRPSTQRDAPNNCHREYRVPRNTHVKTIAHAIVQHSNRVTLVIDVYWKPLLTASRLSARRSRNLEISKAILSFSLPQHILMIF